jgi:hypothetical protein
MHISVCDIVFFKTSLCIGLQVFFPQFNAKTCVLFTGWGYRPNCGHVARITPSAGRIYPDHGLLLVGLSASGDCGKNTVYLLGGGLGVGGPASVLSFS